jgi:hypothetical protein
MRRNNEVILFYSGSIYPKASYGTGVARSNSISGPYTKRSTNPILQQDTNFGGMGGASLTTDNNGTDVAMYHAYLKGDKACNKGSTRRSAASTCNVRAHINRNSKERQCIPWPDGGARQRLLMLRWLVVLSRVAYRAPISWRLNRSVIDSARAQARVLSDGISSSYRTARVGTRDLVHPFSGDRCWCVG